MSVNKIYIDMNLVFMQVKKRWLFIPFFTLFILLVLLSLSYLMNEDYIGHSMVQLAHMEQAPAGSQGMVVKKVSDQYSESLSISLHARKTGVVLIEASGKNKAIILNNLQQVSKTLMQESNKVIDSITDNRIEIMLAELEHQLSDIEKEIESQRSDPNANPNILDFIHYRDYIKMTIIGIKADNINTKQYSMLLSEPTVEDIKFYSNKLKLIVVGSLFGIGFSFCVLILYGIFDQVDNK